MADVFSPSSTSQRAATKERVRVYQPSLLDDALSDSVKFYATRRSIPVRRPSLNEHIQVL